MPSKQYYERVRKIALANLQVAVQVMERPTLDQWSDGVDGDSRLGRASQAMHDVDCAEEFGMTLAEYRRFVADYDSTQKAQARYWASPEFARQQREDERLRAEQASTNQSVDARVAAVAYTHFSETGPLAIDYFGGEVGGEVAVVRQRKGGNPKRCKIHVETMTVIA